MKKLKKIAFRILIMVCIAMLAIVAYFEIGGYFLLGEDREIIGKEIREAPVLPDNFLKVYKAVYPDALSTGLWSHILYKNESPCPCRHASYPYYSGRGLGDFYDAALITFQIEDIATQQECLEFVLNHMDFLNNIKGIENAARYYYNKKLDEINEDEALELIVMAINPGLYNKQRRPELVKQKVEEFKEAIKNKT